MELNRRQLIGGAIGAVVVASGGCNNQETCSMASKPKFETHENSFYYTDGKFNAEVAKKAYYAMMDSYKYPIPDRLRTDEFWSVDFGISKFTEIGMAGIFWVNNLEHNYFGHEIYLLPGQSIPEHRHLKTAKAGPKLEAWHVRHGSIHIYGEGPATAGVEARIPPSHRECCKARSEQLLLPGQVGMLAGAEQWHWMKAGPEGAIVTEYATFHDGDGLRFSHPQVKL
jgi:D-lyxose ketol-isomerase